MGGFFTKKSVVKPERLRIYLVDGQIWPKKYAKAGIIADNSGHQSPLGPYFVKKCVKSRNIADNLGCWALFSPILSKTLIKPELLLTIPANVW